MNLSRRWGRRGPTWMRGAFAVLALVSAPLLPLAGGEGESVLRWKEAEAAAVARACTAPEEAEAARTLRGVGALLELAPAVPRRGRPVTIAYPASGSHLAPLALCAADPTDTPYCFLYWDAATEAGEALAENLRRLQERGLFHEMKPSFVNRSSRRFTLRLGKHPVELRWEQPPPGDPLQPLEAAGGGLGDVSAVVLHDWSGDPFENLQLLFRYIRILRKADSKAPPLLLMEDLERHPYPIPLFLFSPVARTTEPYGHRGPAPGCPREQELGPPLFGGAVALSFRDRWWATTEDGLLTWAFDFLWFSWCDEERRNVLSGGETPLLAPWEADWEAGYGSRSITGRDIRTLPAYRFSLLRNARRLEEGLPTRLRDPWRRLERRYGEVLSRIAAGAEPGTIGSPAGFRIAAPEEVPALREPLDRAAAHEKEREAWRERRRKEAQALLKACPSLLDRSDGRGESFPGPSSSPSTKRWPCP